MGFLEKFIRGKTDSFTLGLRKITIVYKVECEKAVKEVIVRSIKNAFVVSKLARNFRFVRFVVENTPQDAPSNFWGYVHTDEINGGRDPIVHLHYDMIYNGMKEKSIDEVLDALVYTIVQKLSDVWQEYTKKTLSSRVKTQGRLQGVLTNLFDVRDKNILNYRMDILSLVRSLQQNGVSVFCAEHIRGKITFDEETLFDMHRIASAEAYKIVDDWNEYTKTVFLQRETYPEFNPFSTDNIGIHMIYTILYFFPEMNIDNVALLKPFKFITLYETALTKNKVGDSYLQPIVSLNSGHGIMDYNRILQEWNRVTTRLKS